MRLFGGASHRGGPGSGGYFETAHRTRPRATSCLYLATIDVCATAAGGCALSRLLPFSPPAPLRPRGCSLLLFGWMRQMRALVYTKPFYAKRRKTGELLNNLRRADPSPRQRFSFPHSPFLVQPLFSRGGSKIGCSLRADNRVCLVD